MVLVGNKSNLRVPQPFRSFMRVLSLHFFCYSKELLTSTHEVPTFQAEDARDEGSMSFPL